MATPQKPSKLIVLQRFLAEHGITYQQLGRGIGFSESSMKNVMRRGYTGLEVQRAIEFVLNASGFKTPKNLWVDIDGNDTRLSPPVFRHLLSGDVIPGAKYDPWKREKRLKKYLSPHTLDPRKDTVKLEPLTLNARRRFGLIADPFRAELHSIDDVLLTKEHADALEEMMRAAKSQDFVAIIGEVGCGKTTVFECFLRRKPRNVRVIKCHTLDKHRLNGSNIYDSLIMDIAGDMDVKTVIPQKPEKKARMVITLLETLFKTDQKAVIVIDEAHGLSKDCLRALKRLHELDRGFQRLLGIILLGQLELIPKLDDPTLREVGQRVARFTFRGLGKKTSDYLEHKITKAGGNFAQIFDPAALKDIERICTSVQDRVKYGPYPLQLNTLCTIAMNEADRFGSDKITVDIIDEVKPTSVR